jgi:hypothetical protein
VASLEVASVLGAGSGKSIVAGPGDASMVALQCDGLCAHLNEVVVQKFCGDLIHPGDAAGVQPLQE